MAEEVKLTITWEHCGDLITSLWCDDCLKPSAYAQVFRVHAGGHWQQLRAMWGCRDCGHWHCT